jgi:hypothetical protein
MIFIDYLTIYQAHDHELPLIDDGVVQGIDSDGVLQWKTVRGFQFEGSFDTRVLVTCDGQTVRFSGNPSRFARADNVFGFDLGTCIRRVNDILEKFGLPPFTAGRRILRPRKDHGFNFSASVMPVISINQLHLVNPDRVALPRHTSESIVDVEWTGARITRIDLTRNYSLGGSDNARKYLQWLFTQQPSRSSKVGTYPDASTVDWGRGSRRIYAKFYLKFIELAKRENVHTPELLEWATHEGLGRFELSLKSTQLITMGCQFLGSLDMTQLELLFEERAAILSRATMALDDLDQLPNHLRLTARDYLAGDDLSTLSRTTFFRKRKALLEYGIDIAVPRNVVAFPQKVRVIELRHAAIPSFYELDSRLVA